MKRTGKGFGHILNCDACGNLPTPPKTRLTLANVAAMLPIELLVHALIVGTDLSYLMKVLVLTITATVLVIWVADPSAARLLRTWLHGPALNRRRLLDSAPALWRARTVLADRPCALENLTHALGRLDANILSIRAQPVTGGILDELILSTPGHIDESDLLHALLSGGGRDSHVAVTTPVTLADGQTRSLNLAVRVAARPADLPSAVAELLSAEVAHPHHQNAHLKRAATDEGCVLKIHSPWHGAVVLIRPGEPFTPAESARAHRLAELAETLELSRNTTTTDHHERVHP